MGENRQIAAADVMTADRLRAYWFGGQQVPFWNYDPAQLTIGLEIEYFIAKVHGNTFELATKKQYMEAIGHLVADSGYHDRDLKDQPGRISKDTERGFIAIKPDFAWHILEIALPPRRAIEDIRTLLDKTFAEVDAALAKVGLERLDMSCLPDVPVKMELVELDRLSSHVGILEKNATDSPFYTAVFPALIVATHLHLNIFREEDLQVLPILYESEPEAISLFVREQVFRNNLERNLRGKFYETAYGDMYALRTIPKSIPETIGQYCDLLNVSPRLFPNHSFFPVRDMSYIRPTRYGTFEFRSSCSFRSVDKLLDIVLYRRAQVLRAFDHKMRHGRKVGAS